MVEIFRVGEGAWAMRGIRCTACGYQGACRAKDAQSVVSHVAAVHGVDRAEAARQVNAVTGFSCS